VRRVKWCDKNFEKTILKFGFDGIDGIDGFDDIENKK